MLNLKLEELPMPTTDRSIDRLVDGSLNRFHFVRRKGDATADYGAAHPFIVCYVCSTPSKSWDAQELSDELAATPAALNHHLARLSQSGLLSYTNEGKGWRTYILRGGGLAQALELCFAQYRLILDRKCSCFSRVGSGRLSLQTRLLKNHNFLNSIVDYRSTQEDASDLTQWMADFGLLDVDLEMKSSTTRSLSNCSIYYSTLEHRFTR